MSVHYKFKSTLDFDTVSFDGLHISVADLKKAIFHQKRIGKNTDFDLQITNAQTKEDYTDENALIAKNTSLIIARVPLTSQPKRTWERPEAPTFNHLKDETNLARSIDLTRLDGSEDDKIRAMITQSTQDYDPSNYMKIRGSNQVGEVPAHYRCHKCHQPGHWIKNCPLGLNQESVDIKKSTGIPRSFMVPVEGPLVPGAMMTPGGTFAVPAIDHQAYKEGKKEKPPFGVMPEPAVEKPEIPGDLVCSICKDLLTDAVMIPCCGTSFCDECIRAFLLESDDHECPDCNEKDVSPESLIPNRYLRNAVMNFKNETGYAKRPVFKPAPKPVVTAELSISEKLSVASSMSAATPAQRSAAGQTESAEAMEADKPVGKASPSYEKAALEADGDLVAKLTTDDEAEVPPPPGTEPSLLPKRLSDPSWRDAADSRDGEYGSYHRERRRSFSRENNHQRNASYLTLVDNNRPGNRRRSVSPKNNPAHGEYSMHQAPPKVFSEHTRYHPPPMHFDASLRRSSEDRAGTPTVDEPHLHPPPTQPPMMPTGYVPATAQPPPSVPLNPPMMPDPYMAAPRPMPMYAPPPHQQPPPPPPTVYGPPPTAPVPPQRYDARPPPPSYPQPSYRPSQPPRGYSGGPPRPPRAFRPQARGKWDSAGYRGMQPLPPGMSRNMHNGAGGVIDDPLEAFQRMLREKDERDRRMGKHRRRSRSRSRSPRSFSRSRSRSFGRTSRPSRSRSPPPLKRRSSRSPPPPHRPRSRTPKKRRSRSGSFTISRSRSYSRSLSPRGSFPRDKDRIRKPKRLRDPPAPYRSPIRSPPRYHKERGRDKERQTREQYSGFYADSGAPGHEYRTDRGSRYASNRGPPPTSISAVTTALLPPPGNLIVAAAGPQVPLSAQPQPSTAILTAPSSVDRKDYYDSYNRFPPSTAPTSARFGKRYDDVAPPGTEGYYDLPPPGVDNLERPSSAKDREVPKEKEADRYKDDREHRHRGEEKSSRSSGSSRRDRHDDFDSKDHRSSGHQRHHHGHESSRHHSSEHSKRSSKRSPSPSYGSSSKSYRSSDGVATASSSHKDSTPEKSSRSARARSASSKRDKDKEHHHHHHHDEAKSEKESKKDKKLEKKKKKRDSDDKDKKEKKRKKKEKRAALIQKEAVALLLQKKEAAAAAVAKAVAAAVAESEQPLIKVKEEPQSNDDVPKAVAATTEPTTPKPAVVAQLSPRPPRTTLPIDVSTIVKPEPPETPKKAILDETIEDEQFPPFSPSSPSEAEETAEESPSARNASPPPPDPVPESLFEKLPKETETPADEPTPAKETEPEPEPEPEPELETKLEPEPETETEPKPEPVQAEEKENQVESPQKVEEKPEEPELQNQEQPEDDDKEEGEIDDKDEEEEEEAARKANEFLAPLPEPSKWERDDAAADKMDEEEEGEAGATPDKGPTENDDPKGAKLVTNEVLKRAENAIFQKAINAIRPIEIKKISDSRKMLYQNPEPKVMVEPEAEREPLRKSVNVTINVNKNERNVELSTEPLKKSKSERAKFKGLQLSPTRLSVKERLGEKIDDGKLRADVVKAEIVARGRVKDRRLPISMSSSPLLVNPERKVFIGDKKRNKSKSRIDPSRPTIDLTLTKDSVRLLERSELRKAERAARTPPPLPAVAAVFKARKEAEEQEKLQLQLQHQGEKEERPKRDKKSGASEAKKRKKDHSVRSKSRDRKKRKDKKHKKERAVEHKRKASKDSTTIVIKDDGDKGSNGSADVTTANSRRNPKLVSDRKRSVIDEANFEPDYSASDSESEDDRATLSATKRAKIDDSANAEVETKVSKKKIKVSSSDDDSSSTDSSSSDSDSSVESHRKKKKKHKKRKKRKSKKETSSDSDAYSDSSDSSSEEEKHRKKRKSKSKSKQSKKKKKSKHK